MKRIVSVCLPFWPIERLAVVQARLSAQSRLLLTQEVCDDVPFALVEAGHRGVRLSAINRAGLAIGLQPGDALADARTRVLDLKVGEADAAADREGLRCLARWAGRYGILRNAYGILGESVGGHRIRQYGLWVDISGVAHLYGSEVSLLEDMEARLMRLGLTARIGLADTFGGAHALAWSRPMQAGRKTVAQIAGLGATLEAIAPLPVGALRLDGARVHLLHRLGFKTIGSLAKVPRVALERRFRSLDESQRVLMRLDQALGVKDEPRRGLNEPSDLSVRRAFADPLISSEPLEHAVRSLIEQLCGRLDVAGVGTRSVRLVLYRCDGSAGDISVRLSRAAREPGHMFQLMMEKLPALDLGFGVDLLVLDAVVTERLSFDQESLTQDRHAQIDVAYGQLVDRLVNRLGAERVIQVVGYDSHWPESAQVRIPVLMAPQEACGRDGRESFGRPGGAHRPALLLATPEPISVIAEIPEGAPMQFIWRRVRYGVVRSQGPERIEPEWWKQLWPADGMRARDYYTLEDKTGARFWVFRDGRYGDGEDDTAPGWFVHGVFA